MSANTLVTKLKGVVSNDNLPIFGKIKITRVNNNAESNNRIIRLRGTGTFTITSNDVNSIRVGGTTQSLPYTWTPAVPEQVFDLGLNWDGIGNSILIDKYNGSLIHFEAFIQTSFTLDELAYLTGVTIFRARGGKGNIKGLSSMLSMTELSIDSTSNIVGNLSSISGLTSLTSVSLPTGVSGTVADVANLTSLTSFKIINCNLITGDVSGFGGLTSLATLQIQGSGVTGRLEGFAANQVKAGRTTGSVSNGSTWWGNKVTFNGSTLTTGLDTLKWKPTESSVAGAVTDVMSTVAGVAITIDADGNKVADAVIW